MNTHWIVRNRFVSFQLSKKTVLITLLLLLIVFVSMILGMSAGSTWISPWKVFQYIAGKGEGEYAFELGVLRFPRMTVAFLAGAALGVSGLILQEMIRNPLASPDIIGITSGASAAAVAFITIAGDSVSYVFLPAAAMAGAALVSFLIYTLAWKKGVTPIRLVLIGIGMAAGMNALTTMMLVFSPMNTTSQAYTWLTGSVYGSTWQDVWWMLPWLIFLVPLSFLCMRGVHVQQLGDDIAKGLGANIQSQRLFLTLLSVGLAGIAVAFAGGIGFVGLMAPHIARFLVGRSFPGLVIAASLIGGWIVSAADVIAHTAFQPSDIPVGVFISGIGAPFFLYLLFRSKQ